MNIKTKLLASIFVVFIAFSGLFAFTTPASAMTCNSATIYSTVSTYSHPISAYFTYGTDYNQVALGQGIPTPPQTVASNSYIEQLITGLTENTTYYYKLVVAGQATITSVNNFTTPSCNTPLPPVQVCQDPIAINYQGTLPCRYQTYYQTPTVNIYANPSSISSGGSSTLTWNSSNANYCNLTGGSNYWSWNNQGTSGSQSPGALYSTTTYNITCTGYNGQQASGSATVYVNNYQPIYQPIYQPVVQPIYQQPSSSLTVVTNQANHISDTSAQLNSLIGSSASAPINAWFEWGRTINLGNQTNTTAVGTLPSVIHSDTLTGLNRGTTYYFRAVAENSSSQGTGSILSFTTTGERPIIINPPTTNQTSLVLITSSVNRNQAIVPTIDNTRPHPGDEINYTINYQNVGTGAVTNLTLQAVLPQVVDYISSTPNNPIVSGNTLVFNLGTLRANADGVVTIKVRVQDDAPAGTNLDFPATLSYINPSGQSQSINTDISAEVWTPAISSLGAFVFGSGFFPGNVFGWLFLIILILVLVLLARYLYEKNNGQTFGKKTTTIVDNQPSLGKKITTTTIEE